MANLEDFDYLNDLPEEQRKRVVLGKDEDGYPVPMLDGKQVLPPAVPLEEIVVDGGKSSKSENVQAMGKDGGGGTENQQGKPKPTIVTPGFSEVGPGTAPVADSKVGSGISDLPDFSEGKYREGTNVRDYLQSISPEGQQEQARVKDYDERGKAASGVGEFGPAMPENTKLIGTGITKSFVSGIPQLYGLSGAIVDHAMNRAKGGDMSFGEQMFAPGGLQAVKDEADDFVQDFTNDNPDATSQDIQNAYDDHRATPDYYNFLADQMRPGISAGMKNAMIVNNMAGIKETPEGQGELDKLAENLSSVIMPVGDLGAISNMAKGITNKLGNVAARTAVGATKMALPGSSSPAGMAVGAGVTIGSTAYAEAKSKPHGAAPADPKTIVLKPGMTDPRNGEVVSSEATLADPIEWAHVPPEPGTEGQANGQPQQVAPFKPMPTGGQQPINLGATPTIQPPMPSQSKVVQPQTINQSPVGMIGLGVGGLLAAGGLIKGGRALGSFVNRRVLGNLPINVDVHAGQVSPHGVEIPPAIPRQQKVDASPEIRGNLKPSTLADTLPMRALKRFDNAINRDAFIEAEAREVNGNPLERFVQSQLGTVLSRDAKAADMDRIMHHGVLPNGNVMKVNPSDFFRKSAALTQDQRTQFVRLMQDLNIVQRRDEAYKAMLNKQADLKTVISRGGSAAVDAAAKLNDLQTRINKHKAGRPETRYTFTQVQTGTGRRNISEAKRDPQLRELLDMYKQISRDLIEYEHHAGVINTPSAVAFAANAHYMPLYEFENVKLDPKISPHVDPADLPAHAASPERAIDPWSAIAFKVHGAVTKGNDNVAKTRIIKSFLEADPTNKAIREVDKSGHGTVSVLENGQPRYFQFARPDVANALEQQSSDVSRLLEMVNWPRRIMQQTITGPIAGTTTTPLRSVMFDSYNTQATLQRGRVYGPLGSTIARLSPSSIDLAHRISAVDPTAPLTAVRGMVEASVYHMYRQAGDGIRKMAMDNSAFWRGVGNLPGGQQFLTNLGAKLAHAYDSSMIGLLERYNGVQVHQTVRDTFAARNAIESYMGHYQNATRGSTAFGRNRIDPAMNELRNAYNTYAGAINIIHNGSRYGFFAQNAAILIAKAKAQGKTVTDKEWRTLAEETRRSAGDLAGKPGEAGVFFKHDTQLSGSLLPYENISFQTARHLIKATARSPMQVGLATTAMATGMYASYRSIIDRGSEAENWYWNRANPWERIGALRHIPKPETIAYMATHGGQNKPWNPDDPHGDYYDIALPPEFSPLVTMYMAGLEQVGMIKRPNEATTIKGDLGFSLAEAASLGTIPAINIPTILATGQRLAPFAGFQGRAPTQGPNATMGIGINKDRTIGGFKPTVPLLMNELFGLVGQAAFQMVDQGFNAHNKGASIPDSVFRGAIELEDFLKERPAIPDVPFLYNAPNKVYRTTPAIQLGQRRHTMTSSKSPLGAQWSVEFGKDRDAQSKKDAPRVQDIEVLEMLKDVHNAYQRKGDIKEAWTNTQDVRKDSMFVDRNKPAYTKEQIDAGLYRNKQHDVRRDLQSAGDQFLAESEKFQKDFAIKYSDRFKKEGLPPTLEGLESLVRKIARPLAPGETAMSYMVPTGGPSHHAQ